MRRPALTLLEMILAVSLTATMAVAAVTFVRGNGVAAQGTACEGARAALGVDADLYETEQGQSPDRDLQRLIDLGQITESDRRCPATQSRLQWIRGPNRVPGPWLGLTGQPKPTGLRVVLKVQNWQRELTIGPSNGGSLNYPGQHETNQTLFSSQVNGTGTCDQRTGRRFERRGGLPRHRLPAGHRPGGHDASFVDICIVDCHRRGF